MTDAEFQSWVVLPAIIFAARTLDMTLSTLRVVFIAQGRKTLAPFVGFFEALIWILVINQVLQHLSNPLCAIAYASGFAAGSSLGLYVEQCLAMGMQILRVIVPGSDAGGLAEKLRGADFGVTVADGEGLKGPVKILFALVRRRDVNRALELVRQHDPRIFYTIEGVRQAAAHLPPRPAPFPSFPAFAMPWSLGSWRALRKSK